MTVHDVLGAPLRGGRVLFHEHVQFGWPGNELDFRSRKTDVGRAVEVFDHLYALGYGVIVDATPIECGRDFAILSAIAGRTKLQLVAATGMYHAARGFPAHLASLSVDEMADLYDHDLSGANPGGRAGVIKVAGESLPLAKREEKAASAAGMLSAATGTPILTHTGSAEVAQRQFELFAAGGASPGRIVLGHLDNAANSVEQLAALAAHGVFIGVDRFGTGGAEADARRVSLLLDLRARGVLGQVLIAHDRPLTFLGRVTTGYESGNPFTHIEQVILPQLRDRGFADADIELLLSGNPHRWLGTVTGDTLAESDGSERVSAAATKGSH